MPEYKQSSTDLTPSPAGSTTNAWVPQFTAAEYGKRPSIRCGLCSNFISSEFFKVNGQKVCPICADQARSGLSTASRGSLAGALVFGLGGAILGMILYGAVLFATGWTIGYLGLFVGWVVGKAVMTGAKGVGSTRIQVLAALLTYAAITLNALPVLLYQAWNHPGSVADWSSVLPAVLISGLASPFLHFGGNPVSAGINLLIIFIGLRIAWQLTMAKPLYVAGPFDVTAA
jgi:hypothetical protein